MLLFFDKDFWRALLLLLGESSCFEFEFYLKLRPQERWRSVLVFGFSAGRRPPVDSSSIVFASLETFRPLLSLAVRF